MEFCNATVSGEMVKGCLDFAIEDVDGFYFTYKMAEGGFVVGDLDEKYKKEVLSVWDLEKEYTKFVVIEDNHEKGMVSFFNGDMLLKVPFRIDTLLLDRN